jgi:hypothetical protein
MKTGQVHWTPSIILLFHMGRGFKMRKEVNMISLFTHTFHFSVNKYVSKNLRYILLSGVFISASTIFYPLFLVEAKNVNTNVIKGRIHDDKGAVSGAVVRIQTTEYSTISTSDGKFLLEIPESIKSPVKLTTWAKGYYISGPVEASPDINEVSIFLKRHERRDNREYKWLPSYQSKGLGENQGCAECHLKRENGSGPGLPVDEWLKDAHSQSAKNKIFLTLHSGKDISGRRSQSTRYRYNKDLKLVPLSPNPDEPDYGPGYMLDNPNFTGNCGSCHVPLTAVNAPFNTYPDSVRGIDAEGVNCDFCHKIYAVNLDPATGLPFQDKPGVLSYEFRRPFNGHQFFAGPLDDIAPGEDTYSEIQKESRFCAPCHFGVFEGTVVYDSFGEWLRSPYSKKETGKTCQDCHMPHSGAEYFALPDKGGHNRNPETIVGHRMPGSRDIDLLQNAVSLTIEAKQSPDGVIVKTKVSNDFTGHHVPTDTPLRHMILVVRAYDSNNSELHLKNGPILPEWCGSGNPKDGFYAGLPGKVFIKLLKEKETGISPTAAYWRPVNIEMDTRIAAFESDIGEFLFSNPGTGDVHIEAVLIYRRAYKKLLEQKGITEPDIIMESAQVIMSKNH